MVTARWRVLIEGKTTKFGKMVRSTRGRKRSKGMGTP